MKTSIFLIWQALLCLEIHARKPLEPPPEYREDLDDGSLGFYPTRRYVTEPDLKSPETNFVQWDSQCDDGLYTFLTPRGWSLPNRPGPMILDGRGELVWGHHYDNAYGGEGYNFLQQKYKGEDILSFWLGDDRVRGHGAGYYYLMNASYDIVTNLTAANGLAADLHEFLITPDDTALMSIYEIVPGDVSMFREFHPETIQGDDEPNYIWDGIFQEIDIETGELLFQWRASEHFNVTDTYRPVYTMGNKNDPFDWFHINSVQKDELGNYLVSARYTHSISYIDGKTKEILWQLGGKGNSFMDLSGGNATNFAWQHDARLHPIDTFSNTFPAPPERAGYTSQLVSLFDNAAEDQHYKYGLPLSRGLLVEVTYPTPGTAKAAARPTRKALDDSHRTEDLDANAAKMLSINGSDPDYTVRVIHSYENPKSVRSSSQGNMQLLPQGPGKDPKVLVGYGLDAVWTEFAADGTVLCDVHYGAAASWDRADIQSYRVFKLPWKGTPEQPPNAALSDDDSQVSVSWLGSTEVREWVLQASGKDSKDDRDWKDLDSLTKVEFESVFDLPASLMKANTRYLRLKGLDEDGIALPHGVSAVIDRGIMATYLPSIKDELPEHITRWSPLTILLILVANVSLLFIVYETYRRYLSWRLGTPSAGAFRWKKGVGYRLLGEA